MKFVDELPEDRRGAPGRKTTPKYAPVVEALRARAGQWALVREQVSPSIAGHLKRYYGLEAVTRKRSDGLFDVYARWVAE